MQTSFLLIPRSDIERRLAIYPFRWLRYVVFAICGATGGIHTTPNSPDVDYDSTDVANMNNRYITIDLQVSFFSACEIAVHDFFR